MRKTALSLAVFSLFVCPLAMLAQAMHEEGPPKVLMIVREDSKPGKAMAHRKHEAAWAQAFIKAGYPYNLTISSVTGPDEDWFMTGFDNFAALEKTNALFDTAKFQQINETYSPKETDFVSESRFIYAKYRPDLSFKPDFPVGEFKYFNVLTARYKPGADPENITKIVNAAREKAPPPADYHQAVYEVTYGMPGGTYLYFVPMKTMAAWDASPNKEYGEALRSGGFFDAVAKDVQYYEYRLFSFNPRLSYMPDNVTKADPAFWHPKTEMAKAPAAKPVAKKEADKK